MRALQSDPTDTLGHAELSSSVLAFKAMSSGLLESIEQLLESAMHREEEWHRKYDRAVERRKRVELAYNSLRSQKPPVKGSPHRSLYNNPDAMEGPHMLLNEEEFFDALESQLDDMDAEQDRQHREDEMMRSSAEKAVSHERHRFSDMLDQQIMQSLEYAREELGTTWQPVHSDGDMKVYRRDALENGVVCDRLKAFHYVPGVTAKELCQYFFDTKVRLDWERLLRFRNDMTNINQVSFHLQTRLTTSTCWRF